MAWSNRKRQRYLRRYFYALSGFVAFLAVGLGVEVLLNPPAPHPVILPSVEPVVAVQKPAVKPRDLSGLAKKRMTRVVVPKASVAQAPPATPSLSSLVKLVGILEYSDPGKSEAIIRNLAVNKNKTYRAGDPLEGVAASVKAVAGGVVVEYEKKKYRLTFKGVEPEAIGAANGKDTSQ